jgi:hypothetical protein
LEEREKEENLWMIVITWTNWKLIREPLGTSGLKGGAVGVLGERNTVKNKRTSCRQT